MMPGLTGILLTLSLSENDNISNIWMSWLGNNFVDNETSSLYVPLNPFFTAVVALVR